MKITLFGCKDTTLHLAKHLKSKGVEISLVTIDPANGSKNDVAGYINLIEFKDLFCDIYIAKSYSLQDNKDFEHFSNNDWHKLGFCIGWQRLIPEYLLEKFEIGVFGMHGSARNLPYGKGRSPMNWSIIEGRKYFFTNLFKYNSGVDSGPILDANVFSVLNCDTAETLHIKNTLSMCKLIDRNLDNLCNGLAVYSQQDSKNESFYPKRNPHDGVIDWRDDIYNIDKLIRAVSPPFYGAIAYINRIEIIIMRANIFYTDLEDHPYSYEQYGTVLEYFESGKFLVRCSGGVIIVHEYTGPQLLKNDMLDIMGPSLARFARNDYGFFDI